MSLILLTLFETRLQKDQNQRGFISCELKTHTVPMQRRRTLDAGGALLLPPSLVQFRDPFNCSTSAERTLS